MAAMTGIVAVKIKIGFPLSNSVYSKWCSARSKFLGVVMGGMLGPGPVGGKMTGETERHS